MFLEGVCQVYKLSGPSEGPQSQEKVVLGGQAHPPQPGKPSTVAQLVWMDVFPPGDLL